MVDLYSNFCGVLFKNPIITASGTFGFGKEYSEYFDLKELGGITVKGLTLKPREGNPTPRIAETPSGMLNAIGLENPGVDAFIENELPRLKLIDTNIIANIAGNTIDEYAELAEKLAEARVDLIEVNVSCPNVKDSGIHFGTNCKSVAEVTSAVKKHSGEVPVIIKLSPNVTSIADLAAAAEDAGAEAVSLINTVLGMRIDIRTHKPVLANITGGLSGPAVFPIAVRCIYEVSKAVTIPIIGMGGVRTAEDAVELMMAGASLVAVGTASFRDPHAAFRVRNGLEEFMLTNLIDDVTVLTKSVII